MQPTLLANTWVAAHLPNTTHMAVLCCAGSAGEAAFRNSLDNQFVEVGYQHQSNWKLPRRPTFLVVGTALENGVLATKRRITRSGQIISDPPLFQHATPRWFHEDSLQDDTVVPVPQGYSVATLATELEADVRYFLWKVWGNFHLHTKIQSTNSHEGTSQQREMDGMPLAVGTDRKLSP